MFDHKQQRRVVSSSLSSNYVRFHRGQLVVAATILALIGVGTMALSLALGWKP